ncbi:MAG TPA: DegT/DnrJ/EryC1/StrS family aminotransferase [Bdellovibrio sp.]|uniref:DegT/DnrJ/EryC1/StrS family aminotransferase n=1 Tax=Bdellovibrio sp. TaxID=28201 RepID=UPI002F06E76E
MDSNTKELFHSVYAPPRSSSGMTVEDIYKDSEVLSFALARHGLLEGLKALDLKPGDSILIPSFICRDVLAPINILGLKILFYPVDQNLKFVGSAKELPLAKAILAIHYFGLETDLSVYKEYCDRVGAFLIEDNAHGFLSRSTQGNFLGTQGDIGIVSVRKTLPIANGAILIFKRGRFTLPKLQPMKIVNWRLIIKNSLRPLVAKWGTGLLLRLTKFKRQLRLLLKGKEFPESTDQDEWELSMIQSPVEFNSYISKMDIAKEIWRRRALFEVLGQFLKDESIEPYRKSLSANEVPYGYPFFCSPEQIGIVRKRLESVGMEIVNWPALPKVIDNSSTPSFYRNLYLVKFLW